MTPSRFASHGKCRGGRGNTVVEFALLGPVDLARHQILCRSLRSMAEAARASLLPSGAAAVQGGGCVAEPADATLRTMATTPTNATSGLTPASLTPGATSTANAAGIIAVTASCPSQLVRPSCTVTLTRIDSAALAYWPGMQPHMHLHIARQQCRPASSQPPHRQAALP